MKRAIEYATDTAKRLVESLESNDGYALDIARKLRMQLEICYGSGGWTLSDVIDRAICAGFDETGIDHDQWTRDELVAFAYASIGQFD